MHARISRRLGQEVPSSLRIPFGVAVGGWQFEGYWESHPLLGGWQLEGLLERQGHEPCSVLVRGYADGSPGVYREGSV
jgi:hypothetical protein